MLDILFYKMTEDYGKKVKTHLEWKSGSLIYFSKSAKDSNRTLF